MSTDQMTAPHYQLLPPLDPEQLEDLREDIAANGVRVPIDVDENGEILDGHHRYRLAASLHLDCPRRIVAGLTEPQKREFALAVNLNRRHLTREQRRQLIENSLKADPELTDREHARRTGTSHPTVAQTRARLETAGEVESFTTRVDPRGYKQPATKRHDVSNLDTSDEAAIEPDEVVPAPTTGSGEPPEDEQDERDDAGPDRGKDDSPDTADPDPRALVGAAMDALLGPDAGAAKRALSDEFLKALKSCGTVLSFDVVALAAALNDECVTQLSLTVKLLTQYEQRLTQARGGTGPDLARMGNVRFLDASRAVS